MRKLEKIYRLLVYVLPAVLFFSYEPVISFGSSESMNFELSLPLLWLVVFDVMAVVIMILKKSLFRGLKGKWLWLGLPVFLMLSVLWSLNVVRGVLTVGILWLIYLAMYGMWNLRNVFFEVGAKEKFWKVFWGSTLAICGWCVIQCVLDLVGVAREASLLCAGCTYQMFGFPHPDGFAIEPQFMGNLLLAPAIVAMWMLIAKQNHRKPEREHSRGVVLTTGQADSARYFSTDSSSVPVVKTTTGSRSLCSSFLWLCFAIICMTLFLTFSRGAIYAFVVAAVVMSVWVMIEKRKELKATFRRVGLMWGVVVLSFLATLGAQGLMAEVSPTNDTFGSGVAKVLNHLSLGVIDIRGEGVSVEPMEAEISENVVAGEETEVVLVENSVENFEENSGEKAAFDGYVAESTDTRLRLTGAAIQIWSSDIKTALFGVGLGGAGQALYVNGLSPAPKEIVQNQYASLLLESGLVGVALMVLTVGLILRAVWKNPEKIMLVSLLVAYGVSLLFFSGLANALQIYLMPAVLMVMTWVGKNEPNLSIS